MSTLQLAGAAVHITRIGMDIQHNALRDWLCGTGSVVVLTTLATLAAVLQVL